MPIVTHLHGAHVNPESDGYPEAWWLPNANNIPAGYATKGDLYDQWDRTNTTPGSALYGYYNTQRASTLWYHDHGLGMTRVNVYAGPAGFWLIRGQGVSEPDLVSGVLPGPAPAAGEDPNFDPAVRSKIREVPIVIQGRTFKPDGQLFFPENRAYFEGLNNKRPSAAKPRYILYPRYSRRRSVERCGPDLESGVLRQHHGGQRHHLAGLPRGPGPIPPPAVERLQCPDPDVEDDRRCSLGHTAGRF